MAKRRLVTQATRSGQSARDQYYAELQNLELDHRMQEAVSIAQRSQSQRHLVEVWQQSARTA
ncbi:hypothetical protein [Microbacterium sp. SY138]|uniref:hypothetical protein n=1 Tax=Microbacterium sp. SY138 TaxID=3149040 RepID=UPI00321BACAF